MMMCQGFIVLVIGGYTCGYAASILIASTGKMLQQPDSLASCLASCGNQPAGPMGPTAPGSPLIPGAPRGRSSILMAGAGWPGTPGAPCWPSAPGEPGTPA